TLGRPTGSTRRGDIQGIPHRGGPLSAARARRAQVPAAARPFVSHRDTGARAGRARDRLGPGLRRAVAGVRAAARTARSSLSERSAGAREPDQREPGALGLARARAGAAGTGGGRGARDLHCRLSLSGRRLGRRMSTSTLDPPIELQTAREPDAAVIWLHGLGADGHDFAGVGPELGLPPAAAIRFVFPHAPMRPVTINAGYVMRAWYDIAHTPEGFAQNEVHLAEAVQILHGLIEREVGRGVAAERIVVAGFSQGGAVALHGALRCGQRLAGGVILSAPVPYLDDLLRGAQAANAKLPLFVGHGRYDP